MIVKAVCGQLFLPWFSGYLKTGALWEQGFLQGTWRRESAPWAPRCLCGAVGAPQTPSCPVSTPWALRSSCGAVRAPQTPSRPVSTPWRRHRLPLVLCPRRGLCAAHVVPWALHSLRGAVEAPQTPSLLCPQPAAVSWEIPQPPLSWAASSPAAWDPQLLHTLVALHPLPRNQPTEDPTLPPPRSGSPTPTKVSQVLHS